DFHVTGVQTCALPILIDSSTSLLASQSHDIVRFAMGAPNAELIPEAELAELYGQPAEGRYDYAATEGNPQLIEQIVAFQATQSRDRKSVVEGKRQDVG